ncbi:hypothetical protein Q8A67_024351 [Cirrhinus molitorella]|uniref:Uncharacterized protein n=1 Tax=Cirrhinus molitorella TaxID=172907 RepID=A0AA88TDE2_9TELE|nr:hypothetical protein Q8A67_024351 [Cirrhinus molitorella]
MQARPKVRAGHNVRDLGGNKTLLREVNNAQRFLLVPLLQKCPEAKSGLKPSQAIWDSGWRPGLRLWGGENVDLPSSSSFSSSSSLALLLLISGGLTRLMLSVEQQQAVQSLPG